LLKGIGPLWANSYQPKNPYFDDFGGLRYSYDGEIWHEGADLGDWDSPTPNFVKKSFKGIRPLWAIFTQKKSKFSRL